MDHVPSEGQMVIYKVLGGPMSEGAWATKPLVVLDGRRIMGILE